MTKTASLGSARRTETWRLTRGRQMEATVLDMEHDAVLHRFTMLFHPMSSFSIEGAQPLVLLVCEGVMQSKVNMTPASRAIADIEISGADRKHVAIIFSSGPNPTIDCRRVRVFQRGIVTEPRGRNRVQAVDVVSRLPIDEDQPFADVLDTLLAEDD